MKIHLYKQFFPGPDSPGSTQPRALAKRLADRGHDVQVVAGDLNESSQGSERGEIYQSESGGRFQVNRLRSPSGHRRSLIRRLTTYAVFMAEADRFGRRRLGRPDLVIGSVQPLFTGLAAMDLARKHDVPFLLEVRDLWPDALEVKGAVTGWKLKPLYAASNRLYEAADRIVSVTPGIGLELEAKQLDTPIDVFPNGFMAELADLRPDAARTQREKLGWGDDFVAVYTGTHTEVTAIDVIVRAAAALRDEPGIRFELFGSGQTKPAAMALADQLGLTNIGFHDPVPAAEVPEVLAASDVALMALFESPLIHIYFQNKFMVYMGMGKPIIAAMDGQQAELIARERAGRVVPSGDADGMAKYVREAFDDVQPYREMGERGRSFVTDHLLLDDILDAYAEVIEEVAAGRARTHPTWDPFR